jgi:hypothetical protein
MITTNLYHMHVVSMRCSNFANKTTTIIEDM